MAERALVPHGLLDPVPGPEPVAIDPLPFGGKLLLRGAPEVAEAATLAVGVPLPLSPLTSSVGEDVAALWLGPDEWLLLVSASETERVAGNLRQALNGRFHALVDVSERYAGFVLAGEHARDVLAAGCPVDLHPRAFGPGTVVRTLLGKVDVILWSTGGGDGFTLLVGRSFADYTGRFLTNAALEYGVQRGTHG